MRTKLASPRRDLSLSCRRHPCKKTNDRIFARLPNGSYFFVLGVKVPCKHDLTPKNKKASADAEAVQIGRLPFCGEDEIRTRGTLIRYVGLANRWFQPLTHLSVFRFSVVLFRKGVQI